MKEIFVLTFGGIRGAVTICLVLIVYKDHRLDSNFRSISLFLVSFCAIMTLLINGTTCGFIVKLIGLG